MKPAIAVQAIFTFVGSWNNYFIPALVITSKNKQTLPIMIATLRGADYMNFDMGKIYMMITIAIVPIIIIYLLLSKFIVEGVTLGGVKGVNQHTKRRRLDGAFSRRKLWKSGFAPAISPICPWRGTGV